MKKILLSSIALMLCATMFAQSKVTVKAGTFITLQATDTVKAADVDEGSKVNFKVVNDLVVDGKTIVEKGTIVKGTVNLAKKSSLAGTKGRLVINIDKIILKNGEALYLDDSTVRIYGKNRTTLSVVLTVFVWPCIFIPGTKAVMPAGYEVQASVSANTQVTL